MDIRKEIEDLIALHQEGPYWDFKKEWYSDSKKPDMLIDIICMANNLKNRDAYIIIGIDEENDYSICDISEDANRRNTQNLTDFIRSKKFSGDFRPVVKVDSLQMKEGLIDVITIKNSTNTPFFLKEDYERVVHANNIYVRLQDSNTPRNGSADFHHVEYLWKKHFGMLMTPLERVELLLKHPEDWADSPGQEDKKYYKYAPEYTIEHSFEPDDSRNRYVYYLFAQTDPTPHWCDIRICYHQTVLVDIGGVILDGGRYFSAAPNMDGFSVDCSGNWDVAYRYMIKGELNHLIHEFYYENHSAEASYSHDRYEECLLIFDDRYEYEGFKGFVQEAWEKRDQYSADILIPYMEKIDGYNMDAFREEYRNVQILRRMLEDYRSIRSF